MRSLSMTALAATGLVAGALLTGPTLTGPASAADLTTCHGKAVTLALRDPATPTTGTPGNDVVAVEVTSPSVVVLDTGAGGDTVCVYGPALLSLRSGDGADDVDTSAMLPAAGPSTPNVSLGLGNDTFLGGPASETVNDDYDGGPLPLTAPGNDVIDTGAGNDFVDSYGGSDTISTGAGDDRIASLLGTAPDRVDLGDGDDEVDLTGMPTTSLTGGAGRDTMKVQAPGLPAAIDNTTQTLVVGTVSAIYTSFESFAVEVGTSLSFRGSDQPELLVALRAFGTDDSRKDNPVVVADMGGGDDGLVIDQAVVGSWGGGLGRDRLVVDRRQRVPHGGSKPSIKVDLAKGTSSVRGSSPARLTSWEDLSVTRFTTVSVIGSRGDDAVTVTGCRVAVSGGAGRDSIDVDALGHCGKTSRDSTLRGGGGNDVITGDVGDDRLFGNGGDDTLRGRRGQDAAYGGPGRDRCTAERRVSC